MKRNLPKKLNKLKTGKNNIYVIYIDYLINLILRMI